MSQWFSTFWGTSQPQTKLENPSAQKTELIDDQVMQSMDSSASSNQYNKKQSQVPQQLQSQSSNSSGFQQIIIQDCHSPHKNHNNANQKPHIPKSNLKIDLIDMNNTMNFDDDLLNQSISENLYKYTKQSNFAEKDLMNFSYKSANNQSFSELSSGAKQMEDSFSNIQSSSHKMNRQSFSDLYEEKEKSKDLLRITQKPEEDSDMQDNQQHNKMLQSKKAQDEVDDNLSVWGIPARKPSYTESENHQSIGQSNRQSFSQLDDGFQQPGKDKVKEVEYEIQMEQSQDGDKTNELIDLQKLGKSVIAPSIQPIFNKKDNPKTKQTIAKSPVKTKTLIITPQKFSEEHKTSTQVINMGESFVLSPVLQKPKNRPSAKETKDIKNKSQALLPFEIHSKDYVHFIRYGKTEDRLLSEKLLQSITEFFLIQNIMLPIFDIKLMQDVENEMALERKEVKMSLFTFCINLYFSLMDKKYPQEMKKFFESQQGSKNLKSQVGMGAKKQESSPILGNFYKKVFDYLKLNHYSKAQILKKTLEAQLAFISQYKQSWLQSWSDSDPNMQQSVQEKEFTKRNSMDMEGVKDKEQFLLKKIAELEVLISFEKSEMYCEEKLKEKMEENIWKERKRKLIEDRNFFITHFYPSCFI